MLIVVAGTGTEVGKTWIAARLAASLRARGVTVSARKPAQSFERDDPPERTDAALLGAATGEEPFVVCPPHRWYATAMAPPMAADSLGREPIRIADLVGEVADSWGPEPTEVRIVELAGGVWSPHAHDGDGLSLACELAPDLIVLVADAGLGTINSIRPPFVALVRTAPVMVLLNRYDDDVELHRRNRAWLADHHDIETLISVDALVDALSI